MDKMKKFNIITKNSYYVVRANSDVEAIFKLRDMALSRADAMDRCIHLGRRFIEHFDKIYKDPKSRDRKHWEDEMQNWWKEVNRIVLKSTKKKPLDGEYRDWFFTAGENPESIMKSPSYEELEAYDKFTKDILNGMNVRKAAALL